MKIICDTNMPLGKTLFSTLGDVTLVDSNRITSGVIYDADMLIIRTLPVTEKLLGESNVRFIGMTANSLDHLEMPALELREITLANAPGADATSTADYTLAALLELGRTRRITLQDKVIGLYGIGHVGRLVKVRCEALGMTVLCCDPIRKDDPNDLEAQDFLSFDELLPQVDILSLHASLIREGRYANWHYLDDERLHKIKYGAYLINTGRGGVTDAKAVRRALDSGRLADAVVDVWEDEPHFCIDLMARSFLATPHVSGHSYEGKVNATMQLYQQACRFLDVKPRFTPLLPPSIVPVIKMDAYGKPDEEILWYLTQRVSMIVADHMRFQDALALPALQRAKAFEAQQRTYPYRREYSATEVQITHAKSTVYDKIRALGFQCQ